MTIKSQTIKNEVSKGDHVACDQSDASGCTASSVKNTAAVANACDMAAVLRALGHPARLEIMNALARKGRCFCGEIVDMLPLVQSTVSQHLKVLKEAGLIEGAVDGPRSCYQLNTEMLRDASTLLGAIADAADEASQCD